MRYEEHITAPALRAELVREAQRAARSAGRPYMLLLWAPQHPAYSRVFYANAFDAIPSNSLFLDPLSDQNVADCLY